MTNEEAIKALKRIRDEAIDNFVGDWQDYEAFNIALKALADRKTEPNSSEKPQTDIEIARAIVHKAIDDTPIAEDAYPDLRQKMHDAVDNYEPQTDYTPDCPFCRKYGTEGCLGSDCRRYKIYKDESKQGEWERIPYSFVGGFRCSCCGTKTLEKHWNFCPNCGARMVKGEE